MGACTTGIVKPNRSQKLSMIATDELDLNLGLANQLILDSVSTARFALRRHFVK
jgi:hypothetical protein